MPPKRRQTSRLRRSSDIGVSPFAGAELRWETPTFHIPHGGARSNKGTKAFASDALIALNALLPPRRSKDRVTADIGHGKALDFAMVGNPVPD